MRCHMTYALNCMPSRKSPWEPVLRCISSQVGEEMHLAPPTIACQIGQCKTNSPLFKFPSSLLGRDYSPSASAALQILKDRLQHVSYPSTTKRPRAGGVSYMLYQWPGLKVEKVFSNKVHYHPAGLLDQWAEIKPGRHLSLSLHHHHHSMSPVSNMQVQWYLVNGWTKRDTYIHISPL